MTGGQVDLAPSQDAIDRMEQRLEPLRAKLADHPLYKAVTTPEDMQIFMQSHVFAVWDFMSLLKSLQRSLTCVSMPWVPVGYRNTRRLINEIVLGEESDFVGGRNISHLELYMESMADAGADIGALQKFLTQLAKTPGDISDDNIKNACEIAKVPLPAEAFVRSTFKFIQMNRIHVIASAFAFGREDLIPLMFTGILKEMNKGADGAWDTFILYLERHIEVDGDEHGPMSLQMLVELCGESSDPKWDEAIEAAEQALQARIDLWDGVMKDIQGKRNNITY